MKKQREIGELGFTVEQIKDEATILPLHTVNPNTFSYHSTFPGYDNSFDFEKFVKEFKINILEANEEQIVFEMINIDAPFVNAFRRILLSEVPTMAIEIVSILDNTSIIPDEVLSHRLGLIPIKADPRIFNYSQEFLEQKSNGFTKFDASGLGTRLKDMNVPESLTPAENLIFVLDVTCTKNTDPKTGKITIENDKVYSKDLKWKPIADQQAKIGGCDIRPVYDDILIAKLNPGQRISVVCYCEKGIGKDHAKYSPVATAYYRFLPKITFKQPIHGAEARELVKKCPLNVFDIEESGPDCEAIVKNLRDCTMCRECIREDGWEEKIRLARKKRHVVFSIESTGALSPDTLFVEALKIFMAKCQAKIDELQKGNSTSTQVPAIQNFDF